MKILGVIPSRYASTRFPGKPLAMIHGKSMIQRVYEQASKASSLSEVVIATDDERIANHVEEFDGKVIMTDPDHQNGTERCAEVLESFDPNYEGVINIQGDEPYINPAQIDQVAEALAQPETDIATLAKKINTYDEYLSNSIVKVVCNHKGQALYFSRSPIPHIRQQPTEEQFNQNDFYKHIGIYGYKAEVLKELVTLPASKLEMLEALEQLRWLENGYTIGVGASEFDSIAIDTPADLEKLLVTLPADND